MPPQDPLLARLGAVLSGVLYTCQTLANDRDTIEGGTEWRDVMTAHLIAKMKNAPNENIPLNIEPALYEAAFAGVMMALTKSENREPPTIAFE